MLAGCAQSPEAIQAAYVSPMTYSGWSCDQMASEMGRLSGALAFASTQQRNARTNDTVGVLLLGLPVSSLSGENIAPQIARYKGEQEAIRIAGIEKRCPFSTSPVVVTPATVAPVPTTPAPALPQLP